MQSQSTSGRIYRLDKFVVPNQARAEFLPKVMSINELLKVQPGFVQGFVLESLGAEGEFNLATLVEWESAQAIEAARAAVTAMHKAAGFNPQEAFARLGIKADLGTYKVANA